MSQRISILVAPEGPDERLKRATVSAERSLGALASTAKAAKAPGARVSAGLARRWTGQRRWVQRPASELQRRYHRAEGRGASSARRICSPPIAVLVPKVVLKKRLNAERPVAGRVPRLAAAIETRIAQVR